MLLCTIGLRRGLPVMLAALLALSAPGPAQAQSFLADVDDLPLAPGLVEDAGARVAFDKPEGRIVQALARGRASAVAVRAFYAETLPALGWQAAGAERWTRGAEALRLTLEAADGVVVVRFAIAPKASP